MTNQREETHGSRTVAEAFRQTAAACPDRIAVQDLGRGDALTWSGLRDRVDTLAGGFARLELQRGDTLALLLSNRTEFHSIDLAAMMLGAVPFSLYPTLPTEQIEHIMKDSGARIAVIERTFFERFMKAAQNLPRLEHVVMIDGDGEEGTLRLAQLEAGHPDFDVEEHWRRIEPDDLLTLIYTSGTTGPPKGVELTHRNMLAAGIAFEDRIRFPKGARVISWLPAAHIAERAAHHYLPILFGFTITTCPDPRKIIELLPQVKPNWFFAVPRIWEKIKAGLETRLASLPDPQRSAAEEGLTAALRKVRLAQSNQPIPAELAEQVSIADEKLFRGLRAMLGLDEAQAVAVGAAPTPPEVLEFFHAIGIEVGELWGMSETCGAGTANPPGRVRIGTVGPPTKGIEIKLAADGEVLIRGDCIMKSYRNLPDKTAEAFTDDGWLATGDVGEFDAEGYLKIIDRKKELIINAAGKNMSPANIESRVKGSSPLIGQACAIGDGRPYNTALIVLDPDYTPAWAEQQGLAARSLAELAADGTVTAAVQQAVDRANERLARVEQIRKFTILPCDWLPGGDELTPTMKLKRRPIAEKYSGEIDRLYQR